MAFDVICKVESIFIGVVFQLNLILKIGIELNILLVFVDYMKVIVVDGDTAGVVDVALGSH